MVTTKDLLYVTIQFLLLVAYMFDIPELKMEFSPTADFLHLAFSVIGVVIIILSMLQLNKSLSPFPTPKKNSKLITTGLFKYVRHPIYTGILITAFFLAFYFNSGFKMLIFILLLILFYYKSKFEERELIQKFPEYESYRASTGRFFPKI